MVSASSQADRNVSPSPRKSYAKLPQVLDVPNLIEVQLDSFRWFQEEGLKQLLEELSPITDFTGNRLELSFIGYEFRNPRHSEEECPAAAGRSKVDGRAALPSQGVAAGKCGV